MNSKLKILLTADSYSLPRISWQTADVELDYEQTYPLQLVDILEEQTAKRILLINNSDHANVTISLLRGGIDNILMLRPEYVIVQLGMADLWPNTKKRTAKFAELKDQDPWVDINDFQKNIERYITFCQSQNFIKKIILITIPLAKEKQYQLYPEARARTIEYNTCFQRWKLKKKVSVLNLYRLIQDIGEEKAIGSDGIHPTAITCQYLAQEIAKYVLEEKINL